MKRIKLHQYQLEASKYLHSTHIKRDIHTVIIIINFNVQ